MFVYNYMAGQVDWLRGGENDENYDPHKHRKVTNPTTYMETMIHVLKGCVGAGMLAMPYAISRLGLIVGPLGVVAISVFATYCLEILVLSQYEVCKKYKRGYMSFPTTIQRSVEAGPPCIRWAARSLAKSVDIVLVIWQLGVGAIFCVFVSENIKQIMELYGTYKSLRMIIVYTYPVQMLMCTIKDLKKLTPFSTAANFCVMIGVFLMFFYLIEDDIVIHESQFNVESLNDIPIFYGIVMFAIQAPGVVLAAEHNMTEPAKFTGVFGLLSIAMFIITVLFTALGIFGFFRYGDDCKGSITLNLPITDKKAQVAKLSVALSIYLTYPLQSFVGWDILMRYISKNFPKKKRCLDYLLRFVLTTFPFLLAVAVPTLAPLMGLMGALCLSWVAIIIPAIMSIGVCYPDKYGRFKFRMFAYIAIAIGGILSTIAGVYSSILEIVEVL